jgi:hypothetical protein
MPSENLAAQLIDQVGGFVASPLPSSVPDAAAWATDVLGDAERRLVLGEAARELAEREFALAECTDRFETILNGCCR